MSKRSTLIVEGIKNLTDKEMWVYGTSGSLIKLAPVDPGKYLDKSYQPSKKRIYYIVEGRIKEKFLEDSRYKDRIAKASFSGLSRDGEELYRFMNSRDIEIIPITERTGVSGYVNFHPDDCLIKLPPMHFH